MGYDVHITRKNEWYSEEGEEITLDEWKEFVNSSSDMRMDGFAEVETPDGMLRMESEGLSVWLGYSNQEEGALVWFDYFEGNVRVKNPDEEILIKMYSIAQALGAKVQGEECEIYDKEGHQIKDEIKKKWWQVWR